MALRAGIDPVARHRYRQGAGAAAAFAALHVYWAFGGRFGVPSGAPSISHRPASLAYDLIAAAVFVAFAVAGLRLARGEQSPVLVRAVRIGSVCALARGGVGLVQETFGLMIGNGIGIGAVYDLWFVWLGVLFLVAWVPPQPERG
jgi:predicted branched-subunit amino acid permease